MRIRLNGTERETNAHTVGALIEELALPRQAVLVERNGTALRWDEWDLEALREGDAIEILRVAAGG